MELKDTITLMQSSDYTERFIAEYLQLRIRKEKLETFITKYKRNQLSFTPDCSIAMLEAQLAIMVGYINILENRARIEKINLYDFVKTGTITIDEIKHCVDEEWELK